MNPTTAFPRKVTVACGLAELTRDSSSEAIESALAIALEQLDMDLIFVSEFVRGAEIFRWVEGDGPSFGLVAGSDVPRSESYCQRVLDGRLPSVLPDAKGNPRTRGLGMTRTADIGAYMGAPLLFSDGRVYGMLACLSHSARPSLGDRDARFLRILARMFADQLERQELEADKRKLAVEAVGVHALLAALEARDGYTGGHSRAVVELSSAIAQELDMSDEEQGRTEQIALLHDIGKLGVPDAILRKEAPLTREEWELMKEHPVIGANIVASIDSLHHLAPAVRAEHERWDGRGYPDGLARDAIPLASRVVFVCDAYHAMISDRPYRKKIGLREALQELERRAGTQFAPEIVETLKVVLAMLGTRHAVDDEPDDDGRLKLVDLTASG